MSSTAEPPRPLTAFGIPARERCTRLLTRRQAKSHRTELLLLAAAVVLPLIAVELSTHKIKFGFGFVAAIALVCIVLARPVFGGFLLVAAVPALSGLAPGVLTPNIRASEALIGLVGVTILIATRRVAAVRWGPLEWLLLAYGLLWALLGAYNALTLGQHLSFAAIGTLVGQLQFFLLYRSVRVTLRTPRQRLNAVIAMMAVTVPLAVLAIAQEVNIGGLRTTLTNLTGNASPLQSSGTIRATSLFGNWAALAGYLFPLLLVLVALGLSGRIRRHRGLALIAGIAMVTGILLTAELSILICLVVGLVVMGVQYGRSRKMLTWFAIATAIAIIVVGPVLAQRLGDQFGYVAGSSKTTSIEPQTVAFRQNIWTQQYLPAIAERPLTGYGTQLPATIQWPYPESQYVGILIEGGYPLLVMYVLLVVGMLVQANRAARSPDTLQRAIGRALLISVVSLILLGITWPFLSNGGMPQVLWCLFALATPAQAAYSAPRGTSKLVAVGDPLDD